MNLDTHGQPEPWTAFRKAKEKQNRKTQHKKNPWTQPVDTKIIFLKSLMKNNK